MLNSTIKRRACDVDLRSLSYFVHVAECESFTLAGRKLAIAQPSLSRQIHDLEVDLGVRLFYRTGRGVTPTEAGAAFLEKARKLLIDAELLFADTRASNKGTGSVSVGVPPSVGQILLAPLLSRAREEYPGVQIRLVEGFSGHVAEWLLSGEIDLAVLYKTASAPTILADNLLEEDLFLVGPSGDDLLREPAVPFASLAGLPLVLPGRPHGLRLIVDKAAAEANVALNIEFEVDAFPMMKSLAEHGTAFTVLPMSAVMQECQEERLSASRLVGPIAKRELVLASSTKRPTTRASQNIARLVRQQVIELVRGGSWRASASGVREGACAAGI
jgi:LysR family nitrogen assimilation transcriptional regulator